MNPASDLRGFGAEISPEQLAAWNPAVIFMGSSLNTSYGLKEIYQNPQQVSGIFFYGTGWNIVRKNVVLPFFLFLGGTLLASLCVGRYAMGPGGRFSGCSCPGWAERGWEHLRPGRHK